MSKDSEGTQREIHSLMSCTFRAAEGDPWQPSIMSCRNTGRWQAIKTKQNKRKEKPHLAAQQLVAEPQNRHDLQKVGRLQRVLEITHVQADFGSVNEIDDVLQTQLGDPVQLDLPHLLLSHASCTRTTRSRQKGRGGHDGEFASLEKISVILAKCGKKVGAASARFKAAPLILEDFGASKGFKPWNKKRCYMVISCGLDVTRKPLLYFPFPPSCLPGKVKVHCSARCKVPTPTISTEIVSIQKHFSTSTQLMC